MVTTPTLVEAWSKFNITNPKEQLSERQLISNLETLCVLWDSLSPEIGDCMRSMLIIGYDAGISVGRFEALENPAKALQSEIKAMAASGLTEDQFKEAIHKAMKGER